MMKLSIFIISGVLFLILIISSIVTAEIQIIDEMHQTVTEKAGEYFEKEMSLQKGDILNLFISKTAGPNFDFYLFKHDQITAYKNAVSGRQTDFGKPTGYTFENIASISKYLNIAISGTYHLIVDNTNASGTGAKSTGTLSVDFNLELKREVDGITASNTSSYLIIGIFALSLMSFIISIAVIARLYSERMELRIVDKKEKEKK